MTTGTPGPQRLYLMRIATMIYGDFKAPIPCYLIQTGDGKNILVDSGLPLNFQRPAGLAAQSEQIELGKNVIEQLASIGVQPADIDMLISTHYDLDHAGNNDAFPQRPTHRATRATRSGERRRSTFRASPFPVGPTSLTLSAPRW